MTAVEIDNLGFAYPGEATLFDGFCLNIAQGRVTALLGPNGCGKSTLLSLVLGYYHPSKGEIRLYGKQSSAYSQKERGRLTGFVSQAGRLPFNYSAGEYILLGRGAGLSLWEKPSGKDMEQAKAAAERAGAADLLKKNVQELSAGELQLVQIARALAQEPRLLLLDEPTSHLDPSNALSIFRLIRQLASDGVTVLYSTHDPLHALQAADDACLMKEGKVLADGPAKEVLTASNLNTLYGVEFQEAEYRGHLLPFAGFREP